MRTRLFATIFALLIAPLTFAATFLVPTDRELVHRAHTIVRGTTLSSYSQLSPSGGIETVTEVRVADVLKGPVVSGTLIRVVALGGVLGNHALIVPGSPQFADGEEVLLFLLPRPDGTWATEDLVLGKFTKAVSTRGENLFVRDSEQVFGWDADGQPHRERVRMAEPFVRFVRESAAGAAAAEDYFAPSRTLFLKPRSSAVTLVPQPAAFTTTSYVSTVTILGVTHGVRWPNFATTPVAFRSYGTQAGAPNGGIDAIVAGCAMWTNDCASNVNYSYAGTTSTAQCLNTPFGGDGINGVGFNDPCNELAGSYGVSSTTLGQGGYWATSETNSINGETFWNITEGNVITQDNLQAWGGVSQPPYMNTLLAHELGHTLGFRHSDQGQGGGACNPSIEECSSTAIMQATLTTPYNALQPWDVNAVRAVYPGGSCTGDLLKKRADFNANGTSDIWWRNNSSGQNYIWYTSSSGLAGGETPPPASSVYTFSGTGDFNNDGRSDVLWRNTTNGGVYVWFMSGGAIIGGLTLPSVSNTNLIIAGVGDFNGDGYSDVLWHDTAGGSNYIWYITASGFGGGANPPATTDPNLYVAAVADFNADGRADILWRSSSTGVNYTWLMNGGAIIGGSQLPTVSTAYTMAGTGDFNGDRAFDLVWRNPATGDNSIWYLINGNFAGGVQLPQVIGTNMVIAGIGDFNGDNRYDLLWRNTTTGDNSMWFINSGFVGGASLPNTSPSSGLVVVAPK